MQYVKFYRSWTDPCVTQQLEVMTQNEDDKWVSKNGLFTAITCYYTKRSEWVKGEGGGRGEERGGGGGLLIVTIEIRC